MATLNSTPFVRALAFFELVASSKKLLTWQTQPFDGWDRWTQKLRLTFPVAPTMDTLQRTESLDTIPSAGFEITVNSIIDDLNSMNVSEFKKKEMNGELQPEPLLMEDKTRFVLFPIKHNDVSDVIV